jgi:predicted ATPase
MAINSVLIKDFLVFKGEFSLDFCPGVNVIIGGNGTGKTTLIKCLYAASDTLRYSASRYFNGMSGDVDGSIGRNFDPESTSKDSPITVWFSRPDEWSDIESDVIQKVITAKSIEGERIDEDNMGNPNVFRFKKKSVMIPATEMLSHSRGLLSLFIQMKMPFDQTEIDILVKAQTPETREIKPNMAKILDRIKAVIGGEVIYEDDVFYVMKEDGFKVPFSLEASGYKMLGLLWKLLRNGFLEKGTILFWDEPENSLNPELIPTLVDVLLELQRSGVQIFLATHSELLASYFTVLRKKDNEVMFYSLYKDGEKIKADKSDRFDLLTPNNLTREQANLYELEIERGLGDEC